MAGLDDKVIGKAEELKGKLTGDKAEEDMLLARPVLGQRSKRVVMDKNTLFDLTTPFCSKSVELAPDPLSIQLKL